jgi:predicted LPLAT superfamily acyltransferase
MRKFGVLVLIVLLVGGCAVLPHEAPAEDLDKATALFVQRLNDAQYDAIYKDAARKFKDAQTKETILDSLKELTARGKVQSFNRIQMKYEGENKDRIASPVYFVAFDQSRGDLTLNFVDEGGDWKLIGFAFRQRT